MIGDLLRFLDGLCIFQAEILCSSLQALLTAMGREKNFFIAQEQEVLTSTSTRYFISANSEKIFVEVLHLVTVASVNRGNGRKRIQFHVRVQC